MSDTTVEIERKFLVSELPHNFNIIDYPAEQILQGYLAHGSGEVVRIRRKGDQYFITYKRKSGEHTTKRIELEAELTEEQFITLWPGTEGRRLEKTRYRIPYQTYTIELDIFEGTNQGHMLAEVEFASTDQADAFAPPAWFGQDVTADGRYGNSDIATHGFPTP